MYTNSEVTRVRLGVYGATMFRKPSRTIWFARPKINEIENHRKYVELSNVRRVRLGTLSGYGFAGYGCTFRLPTVPSQQYAGNFLHKDSNQDTGSNANVCGCMMIATATVVATNAANGDNVGKG